MTPTGMTLGAARCREAYRRGEHSLFRQPGAPLIRSVGLCRRYPAWARA
ncbi:hypothetical protein [Azospirillum palustre]